MRFFIIFLLISLAENEASQPIVATYYENYSQHSNPSFTVEKIDTSILTDIYVAFGYFGYNVKERLTGNFKIEPTEADDHSNLFPKLLALKKNNPVRLFLSIGGWNFNNQIDPQGAGAYTYTLFSKMVSSFENRKQFIESLVEYAQRFGFDGIDIDWEYPGDLQRGGRAEDFNNFIVFIRECNEAFKKLNPPLLLSVAFPPIMPEGIPREYHDNPDLYFGWIKAISNDVDRIVIMGYNYHTPWGEKVTGVNAPLMRDTEAKSTLFVAKTLENYLKNGVPSHKILLGIPTFGLSYAGVTGLSSENSGIGKPFKGVGAAGKYTGLPGLLAYFEVIKQDLVFKQDSLTDTAYGYNIRAENWVSFDNPVTTGLKTKLALEKKLLGVIFFTVNMDASEENPPFPNIRAAWNVLRQASIPAF